MFGAFVRFLPLGLALWLGRRLGDIAFSLLRIRRKVVLKNLSFAFPSAARSEIKDIAADTYRYSGMSFVELMRSPKLNERNLREYVEFEGLEHLDKLLAEKTGAVLVGAHFGNWEIMGAAICQRGYPMDVLVFKQHNEYFNDMVDSYRNRLGIGLIQLKFALRTGLKALKNGRFVAFLADQDAGKRDGIFVDFFGRDASTNQGAAVFALKTGVPVIMAFCVRDRSFYRHKVKFIPLDFRKSGNYGEDIKNITALYTKVTESFIRRHPEHWFWYHKRWKTAPEGKEKFY